MATGPHADELTRINGRPAKEPIRVYVGLQTADTDESRMAVLLSELERTGAFDREVLVIIPTTGTGWINPVAARALEMMYNGDTAIVGLQYSYLPSWISFLGDQQKSIESGRMMIDAIHDRWGQLPPDRRPRLVLYGESLGSMAGQGAFGWLPDIARMGFSSVLWVGPPNASPLWGASRCAATRARRRSSRATTTAARCGSRRATTRRRSPRHRAAVGRHPGAVPAASLRSDRMVVAGSAVHPAGLAGRAAGARPDGVHAVVSHRDVLAGRGRYDERRSGAGRARAQLRRFRARRLGGRRPARRLDACRHRTDPGRLGADRVRRRARILVRRQLSRRRAGGGAHRMEHLVAADSADGIRFRTQCSAPGAVRGPRIAGSAPARAVAGLRWGGAAGAAVALGVAAATAIPLVREAMAERTCPSTGGAGCCFASRSARYGLRRRRTGRRWAQSPNRRSGRPAGGFCGGGVRVMAHRRARTPDSRGSRTVLVTGAAGWIFAWLYARSGSLAAPMLAHLAVNEAAAIAALAVQSNRRRGSEPDER